MQEEKTGKAGPALFAVVVVATLIFIYWFITKH
jgi:hypothetical protein